MKQLFISTLILFLIHNSGFGQTVFGPEQLIFESELKGLQSAYAIDLDGDNNKDILSASFIDNKIAWYKNNGNANFGSQQIISLQVDQAESVFAIDLDGDNDPDVLSASRNDDKIAWYENDGNGNFGPQQIVSLQADGPIMVYSIDLDGDNDNDILSTSYNDGKIAWYENDGNGNFGPQQVVTEQSDYPRSLSVADLDGDNDLDILSDFPDGLMWFENDGNENFDTAQIILSTISTFQTPHSNLSDLDNDGDIDIIMSLYVNNFNCTRSIGWFENDGIGNFSNYISVSPVDCSSPPLIYGTDLDNDGDQDLISRSSATDQIAWYENDGQQNFSPAQDISTINYTFTPQAIIISDLDGDNNQDLLFFSISPNEMLAFIKNNGDGTFEAELQLTTQLDGPISTITIDLDGDNSIDVLCASRYSNQITWYKNDGFGNFGPLRTISNEVWEVSSIYAIDLDSDGDADVLSASEYDDKIAWYQNDGFGNFGPQLIISNQSNNARDVFAIDLDGDNDADVLTAFDSDIAWYENDGSGNFGPQQVISTLLSRVNSIYSKDLDNDGDNDVLSASLNDDKIAWYENDGFGNFGPQQIVSLQTDYAYDVFSIDIDGDNDADVLSASQNDSKIAWYENDGNGIFGPQQIISTNADRVNTVYATDLDNDADFDVLSTSDSDNKIAWYENDGFGNFGTQKVISDQSKTPRAIATADIDDDNDKDVVIALLNDDKIIWFENLLGEEITTLKGKLYWDKDTNGQLNGNDLGFGGIKIVEQPEGRIAYTDAQGNFSLSVVDSGTHAITIEAPLIQDCFGEIDFTLNTPSLPFTFEFEAFDTIEQDFIYYGIEKDCRTISGFVFNDINQNGIQDAGEDGLTGIAIDVNQFGTIFTNSDGSYEISIPNNSTYEITTSLMDNTSNGYCSDLLNVYSQTFPQNNQGYNIAANSGGQNNLDFGISIEVINTNYDVGIFRLGVQQGDEAGQTFHAWMDFKAGGVTNETCTLRIEHDPLLTLLNSGNPVSNQGMGFAEWIFPNGSAPITSCMQMIWTLDSSAVAGDTLHWKATYECDTGIDGCPINNQIIRDVVINSGPLRIAPNAATLYSMRPEGVMPEMISNNEVLSYVITFNNPLGTTAYNVTIIDQLPEELDLSTISYPFSSYPDFDFVIKESGELIWELNGIDLSDADVDEINSYGFVQFNVRLKENLPVGTQFTNSASIYFNGIDESVTNEIMHIIKADEPPVAICQPSQQVFLDENGEASITAEMIDMNSTDDNGIPTLAIDIDNFDCTSIGINTITLTATDDNANNDNCTTSVEVLDTIKPEIICEDIILVIQENETINLTVEEVTTSIIDNCGVATSVLSQANFTAIDEGNNQITITVMDDNGNMQTCLINVDLTVVTSVLESQYGITTTLAPNPLEAYSVLSFDQPLPFNYSIKLFTINGQELRSYDNLSETNVRIDRENLTAGLYLVNLYEDGREQILGSYRLVVE